MKEGHLHWKKQFFLTGLVILSSMLVYFLLPNYFSEPQRRVASVIVFAIFFWGFEIIPLYATSLLIVILLTFLLTSPVDILKVGKSAILIFLAPFSSPIMMLFLGGLVLAAAMHKHQVDVFLIAKMLSKLGNQPYVLLFGILSISAFFSMWISNTAAAALVLTLIMPVIDHIKEEGNFKKGLLLAIAFGANIGGIGTPIGTPPNAIAVGILGDYGTSVDFLSWMIMAVPLAVLIACIASGVVYFFFPPKTKKVVLHLSNTIPLSGSGLGVLVLATFIILLWLSKPLHNIPEGLVALFGVGLFGAFQLVTAKEMRSLPWDVLFLMWGGLALGEAVQRTNLVGQLIGVSPFFAKSSVMLIIAISFIALVLTSFISSTATANLLLPIALSIDPENKTLLSVTVALACSFSFAFPFSTPPNALVYSTGILSLKDMFKSGSVIALSAWLIMLAGFQYIIPWVLGK